MIIELQKLLQGIVETLDNEVGPQVNGGHARAQFYSCLDLLNNLASKLDWNQSLLATEIESIESALRNALPVVESVSGKSARLAAAGTAIATLVGSGNDGGNDSSQPTPAGDSAVQADLVAKHRAYNQVLEDTIAAINDPEQSFDDATESRLETAREHINEHLRNQTIRDAFFIKPMMLSKISQG